MCHGGCTTSFAAKTDTGLIIIDAGTGLPAVDSDIFESVSPLPVTMLFTHLHLDHLTGLPLFMPLYDKQSKISIMADPRRDEDWKAALSTLVDKPYWPIGIGEVASSMEMIDLPADQNSISLYGIDVSWFSVPHPQKCLSYRLSQPDKTIVVATDVEYAYDNVDREFVEFCRDADFLIYDSQYTPEEYQTRIGWGHSTWKVAAQIAQASNVGQLLLTHHAPNRTDDEIDQIVEDARGCFEHTSAAADGMSL
jgi:ribonuclease BN (tRNA processing enzyme)